MGLILQNVNVGTDLNISLQNEGIIYLARELGMGGEVDKIVGELKKVYDA